MKFLTPLLLVLAAPLAIAGFSIEETTGKHIDILDADKGSVARVMTAYDPSSKDSRLETYKVYTHVFDREGKEPITKGAGGDFTHHRGIFLGWSKTKFDDTRIDTWHMKGCVQVYQKILSQETSDDSAKLTILIHWQTDDGKVFLEEKRTQTFSRSEGDGSYLEVDVHSELSAPIADVELNGDPEHAGCQFRPSQAVAENKSAKYLFHAEGIDPKKDNDLPWVAESFQIGDKKFFAQHISAPSIPKQNTYSAYRNYGRFGAYFVHTIKKGETLELDYRITVGEGELPEREVFQARYEDYVK
ncbi:MAG: DUF6807 family protein [Verrucomicrobiales bacterium]